MTNKNTYASGEEPQVGDIVGVARKAGFDYNSQLYREWSSYNGTTRLVVEDVSVNAKSTLISVREKDTNRYYAFNQMGASRFRLIHRDGQTASKTPPKYFVIQGDKWNSFFSAKSDEELQAKLTERLTKNPSAQFHVFEYNSTAKTQAPVVQMVNLSK